MSTKFFLFTSFLILFHICDVGTLTGFEESSKSTDVEAEKSANTEINLEALRTEFHTAINELKQLINATKHDISSELESLKSVLTPAKNDKLPKETAVDDVKSCKNLEATYHTCDFALRDQSNEDGLYLLHFAPLAAYCQRFEQKGWTIIFRQHYAQATADSSHFHNWEAYRNGFGNLNGDHFLGLEQIHQMTKEWTHELWLQLKFVNGTTFNLRNGFFKVGSESEGYALAKGVHIGHEVEGFEGGDILAPNYGSKFSTYDSDNDRDDSNCAKALGFAWWYNKCDESGLMGKSLRIVRTDSNGEKHTEVAELEYIHMAIRSD